MFFNQQGHSRKLISLNNSRVIGTTSPSTSEYDEVMQRRSEEEEKKDASFRALWHRQVLSRYREREAVCSDQWWREGDVFPLIMWDFSKQTDRTGSYVLFLVVVDSDVCEAALCFLTVPPRPPTPPRGPSIPTSPCRQEEVSHFNTTQQKLIFTARHLIKPNTIVTFSSKRSL